MNNLYTMAKYYKDRLKSSEKEKKIDVAIARLHAIKQLQLRNK